MTAADQGYRLSDRAVSRGSWHSRLSIEVRERIFALACFLPSVALIVGLIIYPFVYTIGLSFQRRQLFAREGTFIGLDNFAALLDSGAFWRSLVNGIVFAGGSLFLQVVLGVALALLLNKKFVGRNVFRGALPFPTSCHRLWSSWRSAGC